MSDNSFKNWNSLSDHAIAENIGAFVQHQRLIQNKTQSTLAKEAGISRSTLSLLERGETVTLATLIQVLRVLDQLQFMNAFVIEDQISPLQILKLQKTKRQRARGSQVDDENKVDW